MNLHQACALSPLFQHINTSEYEALFTCLHARKAMFLKEEVVFQKGSSINEIGLVISGQLHIVRYDFWGNRSILSELHPSDLFGEAYACISDKEIEVSVIATQDSEILFLKTDNILNSCKNSCHFHAQFIQNLLSISAMKNIQLTKKINHLSKRTTREKLLSYLYDQSVEHHSTTFMIPFNRQELADYLCVDRSALSSELGKMEKDGVLMYQKNKFQLLQIKDTE